jgi:biopolymer transport protein ExbD
LGRVEELAPAIASEQRKFPDKTVFLKGDSRVPYGVVREAMHALHAANIGDVVLGTEELAKAP